jgi:hypothetical protein
LISFPTPRRRTTTRFVAISLLCWAISCSTISCTQNVQNSDKNPATSTAVTTNHPPSTPVEAMTSTAFESTRQILAAVADRKLTSDPQMHTASSERLMSLRRLGSVDELIRPQILLTRNLEIAADGTKTGDVNQIDIDATALARRGRKLCHIEFTFAFTQHSLLASSRDFTDKLTAQAFNEAQNLQLQQVRVEPDLGVDDNTVERSTPATLIVTYNAELGAFESSHQNSSVAATTDSEFAQVATLVHQVTDCIVKAFEQDGADGNHGNSHAINEDKLRELGVCASACVITGSIPFQHPTWGASTLLTTLSLDTSRQESHLIVTDGANNIQFRYDNQEFKDKLTPANDGVDKAGNLFIVFNPGRYDGVVVLRPTRNGFDNFGTLPNPGDYNSRFYSARIVDTNGDGVFEIQQDSNDCNPSCASAKVVTATFFWNGADYVQK